jgi:Lon protease-like protein
MEMPLYIFEERYRRLIHVRSGQDPAFGVVLIRTGFEVGETAEPYDIGTAATIMARRDYEDGRHDLVVRGGQRFRILATEDTQGYLVGTVEWLEPVAGCDTGPTAVDQVWDAFLQLANAYLKQAHMTDGATTQVQPPDRPTEMDACALAYLLASRLPIAQKDRQHLLTLNTSQDLIQELQRVLDQERRLVSTIGATAVVATRPGTADEAE